MADLQQAVAWHRQIAALVTAADRAGAAEDALPELRARLFSQQARLAEISAAHGDPLPALAPTPAEVSAAAVALGDLGPAAVASCVRTATATLDATDRLLAVVVAAPSPSPAGSPSSAWSPSESDISDLPGGQPPTGGPLPGSAGFPGSQPPIGLPLVGSPVFPAGQPPTGGPLPGSPVFPAGQQPTGAPWPPNAPAEPTAARRRWSVAVIYSAFALACLIVQFGFLVALDASQLTYASPVCLLVLPAFAWAGAFMTLAATHRGVDRRPRLGAAICVLPDVFWIVVIGTSLLSKL